MSLIICVLLSALGGILSPYLVFELFTSWPPGTELAILSQCLGSYGKRLYTEPVLFRLLFNYRWAGPFHTCPPELHRFIIVPRAPHCSSWTLKRLPLSFCAPRTVVMQGLVFSRDPKQLRCSDFEATISFAGEKQSLLKSSGEGWRLFAYFLNGPE